MSKIEITLVIDNKVWAAWQFDQPNTLQLRERIQEVVKRALDQYDADEQTADALAQSAKGK